jgi:L-rhamnose isomerase
MERGILCHNMTVLPFPPDSENNISVLLVLSRGSIKINRQLLHHILDCLSIGKMENSKTSDVRVRNVTSIPSEFT